MPNLTSAERAGQSMLLRFEGPRFRPEAKAAFHEMCPAGCILFGDNLTSREQVHALTQELQAEARAIGLPPLVIGADQEGGVVSRFPADMVTTPGAMGLAACGNLKETERCAQITGQQLHQVGINTTFAPVVDVNNNPSNPVIRTRAFGDSVEAVIAGATATIAGLETSGVMSCAKHFPGHGDTNVDSHLGLPVINHSMTRLRQLELAPYVEAIAYGVPAIMTTHILFPELDDVPATLSPLILRGILREQLGFEGLIFTDSLSMDAINERYGVEDTAVRCKRAGVDVLESNESLDTQLQRHRALTRAIDSGALDLELFDATIRRLDVVRARYRLHEPTPPLGDGDPSWQADAERIAACTITRLGDGAFAPIERDERSIIIDIQRRRSSEAEEPFNRSGTLRDEAIRRLPSTRVATLSNDPQEREVAFATDAASLSTTIVLMTRDAAEWTCQLELGRSILAAAPENARVIHVALRGPYDAGLFGPVSDTLLTYGDPAVTLRALVRILAGDSRPTSRLPITMPG